MKRLDESLTEPLEIQKSLEDFGAKKTDWQHK